MGQALPWLRGQIRAAIAIPLQTKSKLMAGPGPRQDFVIELDEALDKLAWDYSGWLMIIEAY